MKNVAWIAFCLLVPAAMNACQPRLTPGSPRDRAIIFGDWFYSRALDPITDLNTSVAGTLQEDGWAFVIACFDGDVFAGVKIDAGSTDGRVLQREAAGATWRRNMTWRFDNNEVLTEEWAVLDDGLTTADSAMTTRIVNALLQAERRIVLRFGHTARRYTLEFSVDGARDAIRLLNNCK